MSTFIRLIQNFIQRHPTSVTVTADFSIFFSDILDHSYSLLWLLLIFFSFFFFLKVLSVVSLNGNDISLCGWNVCLPEVEAEIFEASLFDLTLPTLFVFLLFDLLTDCFELGNDFIELFVAGCTHFGRFGAFDIVHKRFMAQANKATT